MVEINAGGATPASGSRSVGASDPGFVGVPPPPPPHAASANGKRDGECETECERRLDGLHRSLSPGRRKRARARPGASTGTFHETAPGSPTPAGRRPLAAKHALGSPVGRREGVTGRRRVCCPEADGAALRGDSGGLRGEGRATPDGASAQVTRTRDANPSMRPGPRAAYPANPTGTLICEGTPQNERFAGCKNHLFKSMVRYCHLVLHFSLFP